MPGRDRHFSPALAAAVAVIFALTILIAISPGVLLYDERYYMESAFFLRANFDFLALMQTPLDLAAGPLYAYLHLLLAPLTGLGPPAIRFVNLACLGVVLWASAGVIARFGFERPWARAGMILAVPMIGSTTGLALTELPGLACAALSAPAVAMALDARDGGRSLLLWLVAGLAAGLAVAARQTYLPGLVALPLVGWTVAGHFQRSLAAMTVAAVPVAAILWVWGGLVPPGQPAAAHGIVPLHGVLAFVYLGIAAVLIAPGFFTGALGARWSRIAAAVVAVLAAGVVLATGAQLAVADRVVTKLPAMVQALAATLLPAALAALAALLCLTAAIRAWEQRGNRRFALFALLTVLLTGTAAGIGHQFSSRYVLTAFPFALFLLQPWVRPNAWAAARLVLGALLGMSSLAAYYWNAPPTDPAFRLAAPRAIIAEMPLSAEDRGYALGNQPKS